MPKISGMKFPEPLLKEALLFGSGVATIPANSTRYIGCSEQAGMIVSVPNASEADILVNYLVTRSGILDNLVAHTTLAPGAGQTYTYTVRINGAPTAITCTISGAVSLNANDLVNNARVVVGDRVTLQVVTSLLAAVTRHIASLEISTPSTRIPFEHASYSTGISTIPVNLTAYLGFSFRKTDSVSNAQLSETDRSVIYPITRKGTLKNLVVLASAAPGAGETFTYTVRVNSVPTTLSVVVANPALTGTNTTSVVLISPGDLVTIQLVTSLGAAVTIHAAAFDFEEGDYRAG